MGRRAAAIYSMVQTCRLNEIRDNRSVRALGAFPSGSCNARAVGGLSNGRLPYTNPFLVALIPGPAHVLTPSTREGSATRACGLFGFACAVIAALGRTHRAPVARRWSPPPRIALRFNGALRRGPHGLSMA